MSKVSGGQLWRSASFFAFNFTQKQTRFILGYAHELFSIAVRTKTQTLPLIVSHKTNVAFQETDQIKLLVTIFCLIFLYKNEMFLE